MSCKLPLAMSLPVMMLRELGGCGGGGFGLAIVWFGGSRRGCGARWCWLCASGGLGGDAVLLSAPLFPRRCEVRCPRMGLAGVHSAPWPVASSRPRRRLEDTSVLGPFSHLVRAPPFPMHPACLTCGCFLCAAGCGLACTCSCISPCRFACAWCTRCLARRAHVVRVCVPACLRARVCRACVCVRAHVVRVCACVRACVYAAMSGVAGPSAPLRTTSFRFSPALDGGAGRGSSDDAQGGPAVDMIEVDQTVFGYTVRNARRHLAVVPGALESSRFR